MLFHNLVLKIRNSNIFGYQTAEHHDCMLTSVISFRIFYVIFVDIEFDFLGIGNDARG